MKRLDYYVRCGRCQALGYCSVAMTEGASPVPSGWSWRDVPRGWALGARPDDIFVCRPCGEHIDAVMAAAWSSAVDAPPAAFPIQPRRMPVHRPARSRQAAMSPAPIAFCTKCHERYVVRGRPEIADKVREAFHLALRESDPEHRFRSLTAHLMWMESELRGRCTNCVLAEASEAFADAGGGSPQSTPRLRLVTGD